MEWCGVELYLTLEPQTPVESIFADLIVRTHKAERDCAEQADWWRHRPEVRKLNLNYALKGIDSSARLLTRLEGYRIKREKSETGGEKFVEVQHARKQDKARIYSNGNGKHP
jgi:hypothetical protein